MPEDEDHDDVLVSKTSEVFCYSSESTRDIIFQPDHIQNIEMTQDHSLTYARSNVLLSMKKSAPHKTKACLLRTGFVRVSMCVCTASLGGSCNHLAALLYGLEEFVRFGLRDKDKESPTSKLCKWNRPRAKKEVARKVIDVSLHCPTFRLRKCRDPKLLYYPLPPS